MSFPFFSSGFFGSRFFTGSPTRLTAAGFAVIIFMGTGLLILPASGTFGGLDFIDALFTATSATCVTGLVVLDTGTGLTAFGQGVVLALIQIGGLGFMTVSSFVMMTLGFTPGITGKLAVKDAFTAVGPKSAAELLSSVVRYTLVFEGMGAFFLFVFLAPELGAGPALYSAVFHSISAFCNAGFSLYSDSFCGFAGNWAVNFVLIVLIIAGGIGFFVISELSARIKRRKKRRFHLSLHTKTVIFFTVLLLFFGWVSFLSMEWHNTLAPLSAPDRLLAAFFQSVTARTAGFNTIPINEMANTSLFIMILLMFVGASPGSCGGGVKTTTLACLVSVGLSRFLGKSRPTLFQRSLPSQVVDKALAVVILGGAAVVLGALILMATELEDLPHAASRGQFLEILFEVVSAFCTVGLSTGLTPGLSAFGKFTIIVLMFVGRIGPVAAALALSRKRLSKTRFAEESIMVG